MWHTNEVFSRNSCTINKKTETIAFYFLKWAKRKRYIYICWYNNIYIQIQTIKNIKTSITILGIIQNNKMHYFNKSFTSLESSLYRYNVHSLIIFYIFSMCSKRLMSRLVHKMVSHLCSATNKNLYISYCDIFFGILSRRDVHNYQMTFLQCATLKLWTILLTNHGWCRPGLISTEPIQWWSIKLQTSNYHEKSINLIDLYAL